MTKRQAGAGSNSFVPDLLASSTTRSAPLQDQFPPNDVRLFRRNQKDSDLLRGRRRRLIMGFLYAKSIAHCTIPRLGGHGGSDIPNG